MERPVVPALKFEPYVSFTVLNDYPEEGTRRKQFNDESGTDGKIAVAVDLN